MRFSMKIPPKHSPPPRVQSPAEAIDEVNRQLMIGAAKLLGVCLGLMLGISIIALLIIGHK